MEVLWDEMPNLAPRARDPAGLALWWTTNAVVGLLFFVLLLPSLWCLPRYTRHLLRDASTRDFTPEARTGVPPLYL
tara:strand:- start:4524 stop:4751 length:228 start_codon:yes stop_codon:yes gene_type:complete